MPNRRHGPSRQSSRGYSSEALSTRSGRTTASAVTPSTTTIPSYQTSAASSLTGNGKSPLDLRGQPVPPPSGARPRAAEEGSTSGVWKNGVRKTGRALSQHTPNLITVLLILLGLAISIPVLLVLRHREKHMETQPFKSDCQSTVVAVQNQLMLPLTTMYGAKWLFDSGVNMTQATFQQYTSSSLNQNWMIPWVAYASYVTRDERPAWEASNGRGIVQETDSTITIPTWPRSLFSPSTRGVADTYFPLQFVPRDSDWLIGLDILSDPFSQPAVFRALNTESLTISGKINIQFPEGIRSVHRFILPWYGPSGRGNPVQGAFYGLFEPYSLIDKIVQSTTQNVSIGLQITDASAGNAPLYTYPSNGNPQDGETMGVYSIVVADRTWNVSCWGRPAKTPSSYVAFVFMVLAFVTVAFLTRYCVSKRKLKAKKPSNVAENPRMSEVQIDWMRSNSYSILGAIRDPLIMINKEGYVIDANDEGMNLTKLSVEDMIFGTHILKVFPALVLKSKMGPKDRHFAKISHPPGPWTSSTPSIPTLAVPEGGQENVIIDIDSTFIDLPQPSSQDHPSAPDDDTVPPGMQEVVLRTKDGRDVVVEANFSPIIDSQDRKERIQMVLFRDMTGWKNVIRDTLDAKDAAELATTEKSNFLAFICHELRNPVHAVIGLSSLLMQSLSGNGEGGVDPFRNTPSPPPMQQQPAFSSEATDHLLSISDAARVMKFILNDMRLLSKIEAGTLEIQRSAFDIKAVVERLYKTQMAMQLPSEAFDKASEWDSLRKGHDVDFRLEINGVDKVPQDLQGVERVMKEIRREDDNLAWFPNRVRGDAPKLMQALLHLLSNAFENTRKGEVVLKVSVENIRSCCPDHEQPRANDKRVCFTRNDTARNDPGFYSDALAQVLIKFEIADTGDEISKEDLSDFLKNFPQGSGEKTGRTGSLAFNITNSLVRLLGSSIDIISTPGQGTQVSFAIWFEMLEEPGNEDQLEVPNDLKGLGTANPFTLSTVSAFGRESDSQIHKRPLARVPRSATSDSSDNGVSVTNVDDTKSMRAIGSQEVISSGSLAAKQVLAGQEDPLTPFVRDSPKSTLRGFDLPSSSMAVLDPAGSMLASSQSQISRASSAVRALSESHHPKQQSSGAGSAARTPPSEALSTPTETSFPFPGSTAPGSSSTPPPVSTLPAASPSGGSPGSLLSPTHSRVANTSSMSLVPGIRRSSQTDRKVSTGRNGTKKSPSPAVRRLGTHPLKDRPIRVLVVEDNEILLKIAGTTLTRAGFDVQQVQNGELAIRRIEETGDKYFDVCLMDLLMPVMDGFQATEEIRRRGWTIPVIALTAKTLESDRLRCFKIGFNYFMTKPFQLGDIATVIRFMVGAEAEQQAQGGHEGTSASHPQYGGPWSKFT